MSILSEIGKRVLWATVLVPFTATISYGIGRALKHSKILDPYIDAVLAYATTRVSAEAVLDAAIIAIGVIFYVLAIWVLSRSDRGAIGLRVRKWMTPTEMLNQLGNSDDITRRQAGNSLLRDSGFRARQVIIR